MLRLAFMLAVWGAAAAAGCRDMTFEGASYTVCEVTAGQDLRLFHSGPDGALGSFAAVDQLLEPQGLRLDFAMNAGMYHRDLAPVGLYVEDGVQAVPHLGLRGLNKAQHQRRVQRQRLVEAACGGAAAVIHQRKAPLAGQAVHNGIFQPGFGVLFHGQISRARGK